MKNCRIAEEIVLMKKPRDVQRVLSSANVDYQYLFQVIASEIEKETHKFARFPCGKEVIKS